MSSEESDDAVGRREVAWRLFAAEFDDATLEHSQSDEERAPNYVITPTGARVNRLFVVGVLTEVEDVTDEVLRGRIVDPTGAFVVYAGQYQPEAMAFLENTTPPAFVAVTGKARTFQPEDSDLIYTSIRPESVNTVDSETRDRWTIGAAEQTIERVDAFETALDSGKRGDELETYLTDEGVDDDLAAGIVLALDHYGTTYDYLDAVRALAEDVLRVVSGEIDASDLQGLAVAPDEGEGAPAAETAPTSSDDVAAEAETETPEITDTADPAAIETDDDTATADETEGDVETTEDVETAEATDAAAENEAEPVVEDAEDSADLGVPTDEEPDVDSGRTADDEAETADAEPVTDEQVEPETGSDGLDDLGTGDAGDEMYELDDEERREVEEEYGVEFSSGAEIGEPGEADFPEESSPGQQMEADDVEPAGSGTESSEADERGETVESGPGESAPGPVSDVEDVGQAADQTGTEPEPEPETRVEEEKPESDSGYEDEIDEEPEADEEPEPEPEAGEGEDEETAAAEEETGEATPEPGDLGAVVVEYMRDLDTGEGADRGALVTAITDDYDVTADAVEDAIQDALMGGQCYEAGDDALKPI